MILSYLKRPKRFFVMLAALAAIQIVVPGTAQAQTTVELPLGIGLRVPSYDRVNGLSLPFGPTINLKGERFVVDPLIVYRSNLGNFDPGLAAAWHVDSTFQLSVTGLRGTFSNDKWIRSEILNSVAAFFSGRDYRNYYRADRGDIRLTATLGQEDQTISFWVGSWLENAWSTGWREGEGTRGPFSFINRKDTINGMSRPNPEIDRGHIASMIFGTEKKVKNGRAVLVGSGFLESAWKSPVDDGRFTQFTLDERGLFQVVKGQRIEFNAHFVYTWGDSTPRQRYSYLGGSRTLPTLDLLSRGGDRLFWFDLMYVIPMYGVNLPVVGQPTIQPRAVVGAAGVRKFGVPTRQFGARAMIWLVQIDYLFDPKTHRHAFDAGLNFPL